MLDVWSIDPGAAAELRALSRAHTPGRTGGQRAPARSITSIAAGVATVRIHGVLTGLPDPIAALAFGGNTSFSEIMSAVESAALDTSVRAIVLDIASAGGETSGLFAVIDVIGAAKKMKPISVSVSYATGVAYVLAASTGRIEATNRAATFGGLGVSRSIYVDDHVVDVASSEAPNKRPDVRTDEGVAAVREYLDQVANLLAQAIATGRGTTVEAVNATYGRGGLMLADEALRRGMIDSIATGSSNKETAALGSQMARAKEVGAILAKLRACRWTGQASADVSSETLMGQGLDILAARKGKTQ